MTLILLETKICRTKTKKDTPELCTVRSNQAVKLKTDVELTARFFELKMCFLRQ